MHIANTSKQQTIAVHRQINRLLVVIHKKNTRISIFKMPKAKSKIPEYINEKENILTSIFFMRHVLSQYHAIGYNCYFYSCSFFKIAAMIIAMLGQKTLHWQLSKVTLCDMYHCDFEAIN